MDIELSEKLHKLLQENKITDCIELLEDKLIQQPKNDFRKILGRKDLLDQTKKLNKWLVKFYKSANKRIYVKSMCAELNKIMINPDDWEIELYAYDNFGGIEDYKWLEEWQHEETDGNFRLRGFEDIQKTYRKFKDAESTEKKSHLESAKLCEHLVILRMFELFEASWKLAMEKKKKWINRPLIVKADGNEMLFLLKNMSS